MNDKSSTSVRRRLLQASPIAAAGQLLQASPRCLVVCLHRPRREMTPSAAPLQAETTSGRNDGTTNRNLKHLYRPQRACHLRVQPFGRPVMLLAALATPPPFPSSAIPSPRSRSQPTLRPIRPSSCIFATQSLTTLRLFSQIIFRMKRQRGRAKP